MSQYRGDIVKMQGLVCFEKVAAGIRGKSDRRVEMALRVIPQEICPENIGKEDFGRVSGEGIRRAAAGKFINGFAPHDRVNTSHGVKPYSAKLSTE